jgi:hypothetical protein
VWVNSTDGSSIASAKMADSAKRHVAQGDVAAPAYFVRATVVPSQSSPAGFSSCCRQRSIIADDAASSLRTSSTFSNAAIAALKSRARQAARPAS